MFSKSMNSATSFRGSTVRCLPGGDRSPEPAGISIGGTQEGPPAGIVRVSAGEFDVRGPPKRAELFSSDVGGNVAHGVLCSGGELSGEKLCQRSFGSTEGMILPMTLSLASTRRVLNQTFGDFGESTQRPQNPTTATRTGPGVGLVTVAVIRSVPQRPRTGGKR